MEIIHQFNSMIRYLDMMKTHNILAMNCFRFKRRNRQTIISGIYKILALRKRKQINRLIASNTLYVEGNHSTIHICKAEELYSIIYMINYFLEFNELSLLNGKRYSFVTSCGARAASIIYNECNNDIQIYVAPYDNIIHYNQYKDDNTKMLTEDIKYFSIDSEEFKPILIILDYVLDELFNNAEKGYV